MLRICSNFNRVANINYIKDNNLRKIYTNKCKHAKKEWSEQQHSSADPLLKRPTNLQTHSFKKNDDKKGATTYGWAMLLIPLTTFGLGCWQVKRKLWKEALIKELEIQTNIPPVDLPEDINELDEMEYRAVKIRGQFLYDREVRMGPRSIILKKEEQKGGLLTQQDASIGYLIITPFKVENRDLTILVNRGWTPLSYIDKEFRKGQDATKKPIEIIGIVRKTEKRPQFTPANRPDLYLYRDLDQMSASCHSDPFYVDAVTITPPSVGNPIGGQTRVTLRNEHLSYVVTWFSLSAFTSYLWYSQIFRRISR